MGRTKQADNEVISMNPFSSLVNFLNSIGVFTYLAYILLFILLYYFFEHLLRKGIKRLQNENYRRIIAAVLSLIVTILLYIFLFPFASGATTMIAAVIFALIFLFLVTLAVVRILGIDIRGMLSEARS